MTETVFTSINSHDTRRLGQIAGALFAPGSVVVLTGPLGSGKTVFVKGMAQGLNIGDEITSPSYTIASLYEGDLPFAHIDLYRTGTDEELELLGFEELLERNGITAVEWGEKAERFLDEQAITVSITIGENDERTIVISNIPDELKKQLEAVFLGDER